MARKTTAPAAPKTAKVAAPTYRDEVKRLTAYLMTRSQESFGYLFAEDGVKPLSEKAQKIQTYISENMGSYREHATTLFGILLGEELTAKRDSIDDNKVQKGALIIATANPNGHNYPEGEILVVQADRHMSSLMCATHNWRGGNSLCDHKSQIRIPTEEEALAFVDKNFAVLSSKLGVVVL